jgi:hypothetical protein
MCVATWSESTPLTTLTTGRCGCVPDTSQSDNETSVMRLGVRAMTDRPEHPVSQVVVIAGASKNRYHRDDGNGDPCCPVLERSDRDEPTRSLWEIEKAEAWREPCQYPDCFGEKAARREQQSAWPYERGGADD